MATDKQIRANRENAKKSTGPKTPEGKEISCRNSFKHGFYSRATITFEEFAEEYVVLRERFTEEYIPETQMAHEMVDQIASAMIELHRYRRAEIGFWDQAFHKGKEGEFVRCHYEAEVNRIMNEALLAPADLKRFNAMKRAQGTAQRKMDRAMTWLHRWGKTPQPSESKPRMFPSSLDEHFVSPPGHHSRWVNDVYPIKRNTDWGAVEINGEIKMVPPYEIPVLPPEEPSPMEEPATEQPDNTHENETNPITQPDAANPNETHTIPSPESATPAAETGPEQSGEEPSTLP